MAELSVRVPIKFSEKAQRDLYETCMAYKKLAEMRGAENDKLREFVYDMWNDMNVYYTQHESPDSSDMDFYRNRMRELGVEVEE